MYYIIIVKIRYNKEKDKLIKNKRNIFFKDIINAIEKNKIISVISNKKKFKRQKMFLIKLKDYIWVVPFVIEEDGIFLKTIFRSRKYTKKYLGGKKDDKNKR